MTTYTCDLCGREFANKYALGPHKRACWNALNSRGAPVSSEFSNSDSLSDEAEESVSVSASVSQPVSACIESISAPASDAFPSDSASAAFPSDSDTEVEETIMSPASASSVATVHPNMSLWELSQRGKHWGLARPCPRSSTTHRVTGFNADMTFSYIPVSLIPTFVIIFLTYFFIT